MRHFQNAVIKMLQIAIMNLLEANGETESLSKEIETLSKGVEYVKKNQMEVSELKN